MALGPFSNAVMSSGRVASMGNAAAGADVDVDALLSAVGRNTMAFR
jgi:hypothetical protein